MTQTPKQISDEFEALLSRSPLRPREPRNDGLSVADYTAALRSSGQPDRTEAIRHELDKIKLKL